MGGKARSLTKIAASSTTPPQSTGLFSPNYIQRKILKCLLLSVILQKNQVYTVIGPKVTLHSICAQFMTNPKTVSHSPFPGSLHSPVLAVYCRLPRFLKGERGLLLAAAVVPGCMLEDMFPVQFSSARIR